MLGFSLPSVSFPSISGAYVAAGDMIRLWVRGFACSGVSEERRRFPGNNSAALYRDAATSEGGVADYGLFRRDSKTGGAALAPPACRDDPREGFLLLLFGLGLLAAGLALPASRSASATTARAGMADPDTAAINRAIAACAEREAGGWCSPPGTYLSGTVRLQSHVTLFLEAGARRREPPIRLVRVVHPQQRRAAAAQLHGGIAGLILAEGAENIGIAGRG